MFGEKSGVSIGPKNLCNRKAHSAGRSGETSETSETSKNMSYFPFSHVSPDLPSRSRECGIGEVEDGSE